jgi:hypothetical protein
MAPLRNLNQELDARCPGFVLFVQRGGLDQALRLVRNCGDA